MRRIIKIFFIVSALILSVFGAELCAQDQEVGSKDLFALSEDVHTKINSVVQKIYDRAIASKDKLKELADFDEKSIVKNERGFLTLSYETQVASAGNKTTPYVFKLDVEPINAKTYKSHPGYFNYPMPLLDLQFSGYVVKHPLRRQFDLVAVLDQLSDELADYQQQFLPLRLMIIPEQTTYRVREPIRFKAVLVNVSKINILVKGLSEETLFFTLNRTFWGTYPYGPEEVLTPKEIRARQRAEAKAARAEAKEERLKQREIARRLKNNLGLPTIIGQQSHLKDKIILRPDEALAVDFTGDGYKRAQDIEIRGIYLESTKGLKPTTKVILKIIE